jgi:hypothetical protein
MKQLLVLLAVLEELTVALESGRAESVQAVEPRLADAVEAVRALRGAITPAVAEAAGEVTAAIRARIATCRRMGGSVPSLLSVMFPGQSLYGRDGLTHGTMALRPAVRQVL